MLNSDLSDVNFAEQHIAVVFGTRPEAIKMAPLVHALRATSRFRVSVVVTAQHRHLLDQAMEVFEIQPDLDLNLMSKDQALPALFSRALEGVAHALEALRPDLVLVHGDTSTTLAASMAAFYARIPVGHVEAGLRTGDLSRPWPEEANRKLTAGLAALHFAPTTAARDNLLAENVPANRIYVTGNTVIDALQNIRSRIEADSELRSSLSARFDFLDSRKKLVLVTGHRRENFGTGLDELCRSIKQIALRDDVQIVFPVHPNPAVSVHVRQALGDIEHVFLLDPQDYLPFVYLLARAHVVVSDSGGIQEEAPALGKPLLVTREKTERPEGIACGTAMLVGTDSNRIIQECHRLLDDQEAHSAMSTAHNPYGDGRAAIAIVAAIEEFLGSAPQTGHRA